MKAVQQGILRWYREKGRDLPWRHSRDPYEILVSEVMLQQTQVPRVLEKYPAFLKKYPNFGALADAPKAQLIRDWEGMGYNNRVLRLQRLATVVRDKPFPQNPKELVQLDGIGPYTAHAVCCFAFEKDVPVVDVNIRRVFSRIFFPMKYLDEMRSEQEIWNLARELVPKGEGFDWNQALMDFGSIICTARSANCSECPLVKKCKSANRLKARAKKKVAKGEKKKKEIPNRIYRGRVVQFLRSQSSWAQADTVGAKIREDIAQHKEWFEKILLSLEKDGMIEIKKGKKWKVRLPTS